jgi:hypothetical protein
VAGQLIVKPALHGDSWRLSGEIYEVKLRSS